MYKKDSSQIKRSRPYDNVLNTCLYRDFVASKMNFDNYDKLSDHSKHVQNVRNNLELVVQDLKAISKDSTTFQRFTRVQYHNLKLGSISSFLDLCDKLIIHFSMSIPAQKSSTELFSIIQLENDSTRAYLKKFNEEMLNLKNLLEPVALKALSSGIHN